MKALFVFAVVNNHIKAAGHCDEKLVASFERVPGAIGAAGNVVQIKHPFDAERDMAVGFKEREIAPWIGDLWEFNDAALGEFHL